MKQGILHGMLALMIGLLTWLLVRIGTDPWVVVAEPEWLGPTRYAYGMWPGIWWMGGGILALGLLWALLGRHRLWEWLIAAVCVLGVFGAWWWASGLDRPLFSG